MPYLKSLLLKTTKDLYSLAPNNFPDKMFPALEYPSIIKAPNNQIFMLIVYAAMYSLP